MIVKFTVYIKSFARRSYSCGNKAFLFFLIGTLICYSACTNKNNGEGKPIARAKDVYLYKTDIANLVPPGITKEDSITHVAKYIDNWIRETLLYQKAEADLADEQKDVTKKLEDYRKSLLIYAYEKELVAKKLDTLITDEQVANYYKENASNFELKNNIVRVTYVKLSHNTPKISLARQWCKSDNPADVEELKNYCVQYAQNYFIDNNTWLLFDDLLKEIPIKTYNKESFLQNNRYVEIWDSLSLYLVNIKGFQIKNSMSPLSFEKEKIKKILLVKRRLNLINTMKETIYSEAKNNNEFEVINQ